MPQEYARRVSCLNLRRIKEDQERGADVLPPREVSVMRRTTPQPSSFRIDDAIRLVVSTSARVGIAVEPSIVIASPRAEFPYPALSEAALERALTQAADGARVAVAPRSKPALAA